MQTSPNMMIRTALAAATAFVTLSAAQFAFAGERAEAQLQTPVTAPVEKIVDGRIWRCEGRLVRRRHQRRRPSAGAARMQARRQGAGLLRQLQERRSPTDRRRRQGLQRGLIPSPPRRDCGGAAQALRRFFLRPVHGRGASGSSFAPDTCEATARQTPSAFTRTLLDW